MMGCVQGCPEGKDRHMQEEKEITEETVEGDAASEKSEHAEDAVQADAMQDGADSKCEKAAKKQHREEVILRKKLEEAQKALDAEKDRYVRMLAEYENFRRRSQRERDAAYSDACADVLSELVPMVDNLERALAGGTGEKVVEGVQMILTQFTQTLSKMGVQTYGEVGEAFDPQLHHAIAHEADDSLPENSISMVFQKGYRKGERVIRYAMVKVVN